MFKGTSNFQNMVQDLTLVKTDYNGYNNCKNCEVHDGFYKSYQTLQSGMLAGLRRLHSKYPNVPILVTGHSLGGA